MRKIKWKDLRNNLLLSVVSIIIFLFLAEIVLRFIYTPTVPAYGYPEDIHVPDDIMGFKYKPNFKGYFRGILYSNISININSKGLRDYEHSYKKPSNTFRIAVLGDSTTVGAGVDFEDTYPRQLEKKLNSQSSSVKFEVIKAGINSHDFEQYLLYFVTEIYKYNPDIVILGLTIDDLLIFDKEKVQQDMFGIGKRNIKQFFENKCYLCNLVFRNIYHYLLLKGKGYNQVYAERVYALWEGEEWERAQKQLKRFKELGEEKEFKIVIVFFPLVQQFNHSIGIQWKDITPDSLGDLPQRKTKEFGYENNIIVIDLLPHVDIEDYQRLFLYRDISHYTPEGYKVISDAVYQTLVDENLIPIENGKNIRKEK